MGVVRRFPILVAVVAALTVGLYGVAGSAVSQATTTGHLVVLRSTMLGANEVPRPGDPNASGTAVVILNARSGQVCYQIHVEGLSAPVTAGHIHVGAAGLAGPVKIPFPLTPPMTAPGSHTFSGCTTADPALIQAIIANPSDYYTNVHNAQFPGGALRGQLMGLTSAG